MHRVVSKIKHGLRIQEIYENLLGSPLARLILLIKITLLVVVLVIQ